MNSDIYRDRKTIEIDFKEVIWRLLAQWKTMMLLALVAAFVVCGLMHVREVQYFEEKVEKRDIELKQATLSREDRFAEITKDLPGSEAAEVYYLAQVYEWIGSQKDYLRDSILMNTDPTNQRVIKLIFTVETEEEDTEPLLDSYYMYLQSGEFAEIIKPFIAPTAENRFITELLYIDEEESVKNNAYNGKTLFVNCVLTEDTDADAVKKAIEKALSDYSGKLQVQKTHRLELIGNEITHVFNSKNVSKKASIYQNIDLLETDLDTAQETLSEGQKTALNSLFSVMDKNNDTSNNAIAETIVEPGWNIKHAALGFVLGIIIYIGVYISLIAFSGRLYSAENAPKYTQSRLLGKIYYKSEEKGHSKLFKSETVEKWRFRDEIDTNTQIEELVETIEPVCKHLETRNLGLFDLTGVRDSINVEIIKAIASGVSNRNITVSAVEITDGFNERILLKIESVILVVSDNTKLDEINAIRTLCLDYDVENLGCIYLAEK